MNKKVIVASLVVALSAIFFECSAAEKQVSAVKSLDMENANPVRGQKVYANKFYKACGITCDEMAKKYTQAEWSTGFTSGKVQDLVGKYCPIMDELNDKEQRLIYDFMYNHAKDSGFVAPCND